jgi:predicted HAD superfamily hydrolase
MIFRFDPEDRDRKCKIIRIDRETERIPQRNRILIKIEFKIFYHENENQFREILIINKKEKEL